MRSACAWAGREPAVLVCRALKLLLDGLPSATPELDLEDEPVAVDVVPGPALVAAAAALHVGAERAERRTVEVHRPVHEAPPAVDLQDAVLKVPYTMTSPRRGRRRTISSANAPRAVVSMKSRRVRSA
jgi:hypothetical protein